MNKVTSLKAFIGSPTEDLSNEDKIDMFINFMTLPRPSKWKHLIKTKAVARKAVRFAGQKVENQESHYL